MAKNLFFNVIFVNVVLKIKKIDIDHIIPVSGGGTNESSNLQVLCKSCHKK